MSASSQPVEPKAVYPRPDLKYLRPQDVAMIEEALAKVAPFGEVHLVIERGRLRFVRTIKSEAVD